MNNELNALINQLKGLRVQESKIIEQIEALGSREDTDGSTGQRPFRAGDRVAFDGTRTTGSGTGRVIGFTSGNEPFLRIRRESGRGVRGGEIKRKPHTVQRIGN